MSSADGLRILIVDEEEPLAHVLRLGLEMEGWTVDVAPTGAHVDGNLVSAKGWPGLSNFIRECLKVLGTEIRHGEILMRDERQAA